MNRLYHFAASVMSAKECANHCANNCNSVMMYFIQSALFVCCCVKLHDWLHSL